MRIRVGVIGVGNMGSAHCKWLEGHPQLVLTAVADVIEARRARWAADESVPVLTAAKRSFKAARAMRSLSPHPI